MGCQLIHDSFQSGAGPVPGLVVLAFLFLPGFFEKFFLGSRFLLPDFLARLSASIYLILP